MESPELSSDQPDMLENKLRELREQIARMERKNQEIFEQLGFGEHQLEGIMQNKDNFTPIAYEFIQRERHALETILNRRLDDVRNSVKRDTPADPRRLLATGYLYDKCCFLCINSSIEKAFPE